MKRMGLIEQFNGEGHLDQGLPPGQNTHDEVGLDVVSGTVSFLVPADAPDDQLDGAIDRYIHCRLTLENGTELNLWVHEGAEAVDVRLSKPEVALTAN